MSTWTALRRAMPVTEQLAYLDHAAVAPLSAPCFEEMQRYLAELSRFGAARFPDHICETVTRCRTLGAELLGTHTDSVFFVRSTTQGLSIPATGLRVEEGDNVVLVQDELPANIRPWLPLRQRGVVLRFVPQREGCVPVDDLAAAMDARTAAVSVSFVQYLSGFRVDLARVAQLCRDRDALLVVDAIQGLGAFPLDVEATGVDFVSADAHKWLLGPEGVGLGYASPRAIERIEPAVQGWLSVQRPFDLADTSQLLEPCAARYEEGSYNLAGLHGLVGSLGLLLSIGVEAISARILRLTDLLAEGLRRRGWVVLSPWNSPEERSGILLCTRAELDVRNLRRQLMERDFVVSVRGGALRLSPHAYNTDQEVGRLLEALDELTG